ncbi:hypothetical protein BKA83DRAFT_18592 [Pisolithus microcarpus]|nr:hypothetical protein BKA83DRAFT_18592 [Pisolithus microcarpus]
MAVKRYYTKEGFVYVPELKKNGRNWNEYREQVLEVARIQNLLGHLAGVEQKPKVAGNKLEEWLQQDSSAQSMLMWNIPDSLFSRIQHLETAHEMFNYLATTFRDFTPIPLPTEKCVEAPSGDVAADEPLSTKDLPKQKNGSAFEAHASVEPLSEERLEDELTEARSDDKAEAAVGAAQQVLSRSIEVEDHVPDMPSELHMAWSELQEQPSSRAGEPLESEHPDVLNGTVEVPYEVKDVDRAAELASEAAGRARRVNTSDEIAQEDQPSKLCNRSTNDLPGARRLLLEGEQAMCTSGSPRNPNSIEDEQPRLMDVSSYSFGRGTDTGTSVCKAHTPNASSSTTNGQSHYTKEPQPTIYDPGGTLEWPMACCQKAEKGEETAKVESIPASPIECPQRVFEAPHQCGRLKQVQSITNGHGVPLEGETIGGTSDSASRSHPSKQERPQTGSSPALPTDPMECPLRIFRICHRRGRLKTTAVDVSEAEATCSTTFEERIKMVQGNIPNAQRLPLEGEQASCVSGNTTSTGANGHADRLNGYVKRDVPDTQGVLLEGEQARIVSCDKANLRGCTSTSRVLGMHADDPSRQEEPITTSIESTSVNGSLKMASDTSKNIRTARAKSATQNSPEQLQKEPFESTMPWRRVGIGDIDAPTPQNVPIEALSFKNQDITLGRLASPNEGHVASGVEGKKAGGIGEPTHGKDDTKNSGNVGSERIEAALLAGDSQDAYRGQNERGDSPMSSWPPTRLRKHPYEAIRPRRRRGRIKFEAGNVRRKRKCKNVYQGRGNMTSHAREGIGTSHSLTIKPRMQERCQRHIRHDARSVEALQSTKSAHSKLKVLHGETAAPDDLQGPKECPEDTRNQRGVNMNPSSQIEGLGGQEEGSKMFGVVEDELRFQNDEEHVGMDGKWCRMDGATSSASRDSKRVETRLLAGDKGSGQHERQKQKPNDIPEPPTPLGIHLRRPTKPVIQPQRRRKLKSRSRSVSHKHDATYQIGQLRSHTLQSVALEAREQEKSLPLRYKAEKRESKSTEMSHATYRTYVQSFRVQNAKTEPLERVEGDHTCRDNVRATAQCDFPNRATTL